MPLISDHERSVFRPFAADWFAGGDFNLRTSTFALCLAVVVGSTAVPAEEAVDVTPLLATIRAVKKHGEGHREAAAAWPRLAAAQADQLPEILAGMQGADILACNWIRSAVETIVQRHLDERWYVASLGTRTVSGGRTAVAPCAAAGLRASGPRRRERLAAFVGRTAGRSKPGTSPRCRGHGSEGSGIARRDRSSGRPEGLPAPFVQLGTLSKCGRSPARIRDLGGEVNLSQHFGFLLHWKVVGPFDNTGGAGLEAVYPPEQEVNLNATFPGKLGEVRWQEAKAVDEYGLVDLNDGVRPTQAAHRIRLRGHPGDAPQIPRRRGVRVCGVSGERAARRGFAARLHQRA